MLDTLLDTTLLGYTKLGPKLRHLTDPMPRLDGRRAVVTGATSGLGRATAKALFDLGADVILVARDEEKARRVAAALRGDTSRHVAIEIADLSKVREVEGLAARLLARPGGLHLLVNAAGVLLPERTFTDEGLETTFATNLLATFLLTERLLPKLVASARADLPEARCRIVNVSSGGMYTARLHPEDPMLSQKRFDGARFYAHTKRAQVVLTERWAERTRDDGVAVHAMHPGWADTEGVRRSLPRFHKLTKPLLRSPEQGADTIVWLCAAAEPGRTTGVFWHDRQPRPTHRVARTRESREERETFSASLWRFVQNASET